MIENELSKIIIGCAVEVHQKLGPGLLESAYQKCLYYELIQKGFSVDQQKSIPLVYRDVQIDMGYRADLIVDKKVILELKSVEALNDIHLAQTLTYLRLSGLKLGLLLNFNVVKMVTGIRRVVNNL